MILSSFLLYRMNLDLNTRKNMMDLKVNAEDELTPVNEITMKLGDDISTTHSTILDATNTSKSNWFTYFWGDIFSKEDPNLYPQSKKNVIIFLVAIGGLCGPLSSMMYMPGILAVAEDLKTTISAVNGTISAYVVFMGISVSSMIRRCRNFFFLTIQSSLSFGPY